MRDVKWMSRNEIARGVGATSSLDAGSALRRDDHGRRRLRSLSLPSPPRTPPVNVCKHPGAEAVGEAQETVRR